MDNTIDHTFESANRVYDENGLAPTINTCGGGGLQPKILVSQTTAMEPVLVGGFGEKNSNNGTQYYFQDRVYGTDTVSVSVTSTFQPNYLVEESVKKMGNTEVKKVGNLSDANTQSRTVYDADGISPTLCSGMDHGNTMPHIFAEKVIIDDTQGFENHARIYSEHAPCLRSERNGLKTIVAMRGRNPENPSDRTKGAPMEQRLEPNVQGLCNTLTSVQKDNLVMERADVVIGGLQEHQTPRTDGISPTLTSAMGMGGGQIPLINETVQDNGDICPAITAMENGLHRNESVYRIRRLTEKECWRLMNFKDDDFNKAAQVNSPTQLYKQSGNSIVRNCLVAIIGQMLEGKEEVYKGVQHEQID